MCLTFLPGVAPESTVLVSYWYHSYGAQFLCWRLCMGEEGKTLPTRGEGWPSVLRAYKTPIFLKAKS